MKSAQDVFREQITAMLDKANRIILDVSDDLRTREQVERCAQVINLVKFATEALTSGNIGGALGVAQEAELGATKLYSDLLEHISQAEVVEQEGESSLSVNSRERIEIEAMIAEARAKLMGVAQDVDDPAVYEKCMTVKDLLARATAAMDEARFEEAQELALRAVDSASLAEDLSGESHGDRERRSQLEQELLGLRAAIWPLIDEASTLAEGEKLYAKAEEMKACLASDQVQKAEEILVQVKHHLSTMHAKQKAPIAAEEAQERLKILDQLSEEWGVQVFEGAMETLAKGANDGERNTLAEVLQRLISRSLQTGKPMTEEMAKDVLRGA